ncbi:MULTISPECIES: tRNA (N6-threonylcarbamoyladenosine(37)-N6)-methyltransferase TrmO [Eikenella]|uniref:Methyltransferase, YaeB family n=2 Tax=Eikenella corrodens TaxID=539 RepID=C0DW56_EIKCO|nr:MULTISPECIES: tRNA (N6-threonylcarbamoyladenosine(37)-N6)-methyltransferase TrmO [Eikenella]EEG23724.1 methyltransferase, YaeB family [Eikenella corrodens ATCC 23834]MDU1345927.1 tRNA (N6-threonylcarbamoyladenosine(37)-N6)-methyltransferase TrmO [Eikenella corrodens]MDU4301095.1 tRNA (N6-threonylcarbamoyladenosine(37)-N6)-methyltransferase TrmO [Eikenella corrodens]OAM15873.1 tRNA-Thr(GGU) m(6)t(6)A37 methyltransferase TsaA [Eikenella corrodens]OFN61458.1 tRNA-Thr(GGU) m(6)t(6)A37 methyltra
MEITLSPIGRLETPFNDIADMPIQPSVLADTRGKAVLDEKFVPGLKDLDGFSHIILLFLLHKISGYQLEVVPFMDTLPHGIFATRSPKRPNRIGMSIVRVESVVGNIVHFKGVDMLNGSPLLDIKPYYSYFDQQTQVRNGWLEGKTLRPENLRSDKRFES